MANIMGHQKQYEVSQTITATDSGFWGNSEDKVSKHVKTVDKYKISPDTIMELKTGEAIIYRKVLQQRPQKIKIRVTNTHQI